MTTKLNEDNISIVVNNGIQWQEIITAAGGSTNGVAGQGYLIDTSSDVHTINLPSGVEKGDTIAIKDYAGTFGTNGVTINRNGHNIQGVSENSRIDTNRASVELVYVDSTKGWIYINESNVSVLGPQYVSATGGTVTESGDFKIHTFTGDGSFVVSSNGNPVGSDTVDYLVIAGGGSGGSGGCTAGGGGGGGAGGYRESSGTASGCYTVSPLGACVSALPVSVTTYPISVGGGGSGVSNPTIGTVGQDGSNSVFHTITSSGGGGGGRGLSAPETTYGAGRSGGSGGGAGSGGGSAVGSASGGSGNSPPVSPPQGRNGGPVGPGSNIRGSSGGGGALNAGATGVTNNAGFGGDGATSSINNTPTIRAGGGGGSTSGGGGSPASVCGGAGGGGNGATDGGNDAVSGTANTGGGGGGASDTLGFTSGAGGKGIVIIRYKFQ